MRGCRVSDDEAAINLEDSKSLYEEVNPGNQVNGVVLFDVPKGTKPTAVELHDSTFSGGVKSPSATTRARSVDRPSVTIAGLTGRPR